MVPENAPGNRRWPLPMNVSGAAIDEAARGLGRVSADGRLLSEGGKSAG